MAVTVKNWIMYCSGCMPVHNSQFAWLPFWEPGLSGALGALGAKKRHTLLGRGALQNFGDAEIQNQHSSC